MPSIPNELITIYLEMTDPAEFTPGFVDDNGLAIMPMQIPDIEFYRFLYRTVGEMWRWRDRLIMPMDELRAILESDAVDIFVMYSGGVPAGYVELARTQDNQVGTHHAASLRVAVEIAYFGLRPEFIGRGLGKHLLSYGVQQAWETGADRVWLHTCNLDGPYALANYQARGFCIYDEKREPMPEQYL